MGSTCSTYNTCCATNGEKALYPDGGNFEVIGTINSTRFRPIDISESQRKTLQTVANQRNDLTTALLRLVQI